MQVKLKDPSNTLGKMRTDPFLLLSLQVCVERRGESKSKGEHSFLSLLPRFSCQWQHSSQWLGRGRHCRLGSCLHTCPVFTSALEANHRSAFPRCTRRWLSAGRMKAAAWLVTCKPSGCTGTLLRKTLLSQGKQPGRYTEHSWRGEGLWGTWVPGSSPEGSAWIPGDVAG